MAEAKLDITGSGDVANRELDKLVKSNAKLRETVRQLNETAAKGFKESGDAVSGFSAKLSQASASTSKWADGMKRLQQQVSLTKADFSALLPAMQKTVATKDPFGPWVQGLEKLKQQNDKWASGMKKLEASSAPFIKKTDAFQVSVAQLRQIQDSTTTSVNNWASGMASAVGPLALVSTGVTLAKKALFDYRTELDAIAIKQQEFSQRLSPELSKQKTVEDAQQLERFIPSVRGVKKEDVLTTFQAVSAAQPEATLGTKKAITASASRLAPTGRHAAIGGLAGELGDVTTGMKPEDLVDLAVFMEREAGGDVSKLGGDKFGGAIANLIKAGVPQSEALAMGAAAARGKIKAETLNAIGELAVASKGQLVTAGAVGPEASAKRRLAGMSGLQRVKAIQSDPKLAQAALGDKALAFSRLNKNEISELQKDIETIPSRDLVGESLEAEGSTRTGLAVGTRYSKEAEKGRRQQMLARREELLNVIREAVRTEQSDQGIIGRTAAEGSIFFEKMGTAALAPTRGEKAEQFNANLELMVYLMRRQVQLQEAEAGKRNVDANTE